MYHRRKQLILALALSAFSSVSGEGLFHLSGEQCVGTFFDQSRLENLTKETVTLFAGGSFSRDGGQEFSFVTRQVNQVISAGEKFCMAERHRVRESINNLPIYGADFVVTVSSCSGLDQGVSVATNTLATLDLTNVRSADGHIVNSVAVPSGYSAKRSRNDAIKMMAGLYQVTEEKVTTINLEIYPTKLQDYRAWIATILVDTAPGEPRLYQAIVDDETENIILQCVIAGLREKAERAKMIRRRAEEDDGNGAPLDMALCTSCAAYNSEIVWNSAEIVECDANTLYMNNEGRKTLCISGIDGENNTYVGPGPVPSLHWLGTFNCGSATYCGFSPMPECQDSIHDIQWGAINFLQYMKEHHGMMGGLVKDGDNPKPVIGKAHFDNRFCNAFFSPGENTVTFGDCDCELFTPMVSTDVVVHEIVHGMTSESSQLIYFLEPGGLNEAYSDIMACALEFTINDDLDSPDFTVGESISNGYLRQMEFPSQDGKSIDTICDYEQGMNVHFSSGYLNRAYVNAVRDCESKCGTTSECAVLIADTFMYTNLETLSMVTSFRQAAEQTCRNVDDYFLAHGPATSCTVQEVRSSVTVGFAAVGVLMLPDECFAKITCEQKGLWQQTQDAFKNAVLLGVKLCESMRERFSFF